MVVLHVAVQVKPEHIAEFLEVIRYDAEHSENEDEPNRFYFYEVYRDEAALEAHRQTPHFKHYLEKSRSLLVTPPERRIGRNLIPSDADWR
jgi:autoinducer 2-degrading protein